MVFFSPHTKSEIIIFALKKNKIKNTPTPFFVQNYSLHSKLFGLDNLKYKNGTVDYSI